MNGQQLIDTDEKIQYAPAGIDHVLVGDLEANCNYSCTIWEHTVHDAQVLHRHTSEPIHFTTEYGGTMISVNLHMVLNTSLLLLLTCSP